MFKNWPGKLIPTIAPVHCLCLSVQFTDTHTHRHTDTHTHTHTDSQTHTNTVHVCTPNLNHTQTYIYPLI